MKALSKTHKYLLKYKWRLLLGIGFVFTANFFALYPAKMVRQTFDLVANTFQMCMNKLSVQEKEALLSEFNIQILQYGLTIVGMALLRGVFMYLMRQTIIVMSRHIEYDQKNEIYRHYQALPLAFYKSNNTGDLMARISEDVSKVRMYFGPAIMYGLNLISMVLLCVPIMLSISVKLTLWALLPLPLLSLLIYKVNNLIEKRSTKIQEGLSELSTFIQESMSGVRVIKAFARESDFSKVYADKSREYTQKQLNLAKVNSLFSPTVMALVGLSIVIVVYVGGMETINGNMTAGNIAEFIMYITLLTWPFTSLGWISSIIQRAEASQKRINEFLSVKPNEDIDSNSNPFYPSIRGKIDFSNVVYSYKNTGITALKNISFTINSGQSLAVIGPPGSGKSTLAMLMCRMDNPTKGIIQLDDIPIEKINLEHYRGVIGYVPQEVFLFSDTIYNNIAFGIETATPEKVEWAARQAHLWDNISQLPDGIYTRVGERGVTLSGGQKQRVAIARALIKNPKILILDDCLSAVDTETEHIILSNLAQFMEHRTTIIISHRVSSAKLAQHILVLQNGGQAEYGTHDELMQNQGYYAQVYLKQMSTT